LAAADTDDSARTRAGEDLGIAVHNTIEELLADPGIEAVAIAAPDRTHFALAAAALAAGRDVLVEKPMALEREEAEALALQADASKRVLAVGHTAVYHPSFAALMDEVAGAHHDADRRASAARSSAGYADGRSNPILDLCPHDLAMAVLLFGPPVAARARCSGASVEYDVRFQRDVLLTGRAEWCRPPHVRRFEVARVAGLAGLIDPVPDTRHSSCDVRNSPLGRQCLDFIECCHTRRQPLSNGRLGVEVTRCLAALTASCADSNAWVPLAGPGRTRMA
jgi:predicted dehydrogenase